MHCSPTGIEFRWHRPIGPGCGCVAHGDTKVAITLSQWITTDSTCIVVLGFVVRIYFCSSFAACDRRGGLTQMQVVSTRQRAPFCRSTICFSTAATDFLGTERLLWFDSIVYELLIGLKTNQESLIRFSVIPNWARVVCHGGGGGGGRWSLDDRIVGWDDRNVDRIEDPGIAPLTSQMLRRKQSYLSLNTWIFCRF